ncbi:MAG: hypothetical protein M1818_004841 [Claussenomyces sp. TS43310]|nr:MAG: hypothetical protein M1818_004841 [Claussenomyces sp. TS43310]
MDYSSYFPPAPQPYQFVELPPTPSHTAVRSEKFESPPHHAYDFQNFDFFNQYDAQGIPRPPSPQSQPRESAAPQSNDATEIFGDMNGELQRQGSASDDDDMVPAKSRRKAQNRAAQRAFRERKERHVKELEDQVAALKQAADTIKSENEILKLSLQKVSTENEILKATAQHARSQSPPLLPDTTGPMSFSPKDFYAEVLHAHDNKVPSHRIVVDEQSGSRLLGAAATWDFILASESYKKGSVDVASVSDYLKMVARCDGQGPVFEEKEIVKAIEMSASSGSDELI